MRLQQQFCQYVWLVETLRREALTLEQLSEKWKDTEISGGLPLSRTTFNRMRDAVQDMFGVIIECEVRNKYVYRISNPQILECKNPHGHCIFAKFNKKYL